MFSIGLKWSELAVEVPKKSFCIIYCRKSSYEKPKLVAFQTKF